MGSVGMCRLPRSSRRQYVSANARLTSTEPAPIGLRPSIHTHTYTHTYIRSRTLCPSLSSACTYTRDQLAHTPALCLACIATGVHTLTVFCHTVRVCNWRTHTHSVLSHSSCVATWALHSPTPARTCPASPYQTRCLATHAMLRLLELASVAHYARLIVSLLSCLLLGLLLGSCLHPLPPSHGLLPLLLSCLHSLGPRLVMFLLTCLHPLTPSSHCQAAYHCHAGCTAVC